MQLKVAERDNVMKIDFCRVEMYYIQMKVLSLYSTATQNYWHWVLLCYLTQKMTLLLYLTQGDQCVLPYAKVAFLPRRYPNANQATLKKGPQYRNGRKNAGKKEKSENMKKILPTRPSQGHPAGGQESKLFLRVAPVEYRLRWVPGVGSLRWACRFHIFVLISFAFGSRRKRNFQWNMGFRLIIELSKKTYRKKKKNVGFVNAISC